MIYRILHWLTGCHGHSAHEYDKLGIDWVGFKCVTCGKFTPLSPSIIQTNRGWAELEKQGHPDAATRIDDNAR